MPISFAQLTSVISNYSTEYSLLDNDMMFAHITPNGLPVIHEAVRIDGPMIVVGIKGELHLEIDLKECVVTPGSLICLGLDNIVRILKDSSHDFDAYAVIVSPSFMSDINIDLNVVNIPSIAKAKRTSQFTFINLHHDDHPMIYRLIIPKHAYNSLKPITIIPRSLILTLHDTHIYPPLQMQTP